MTNASRLLAGTIMTLIPAGLLAMITIRPRAQKEQAMMTRMTHDDTPALGDVVLEHDGQTCTAVWVSDLGSYAEQWSDQPDQARLYLVGDQETATAELDRYDAYAQENGLPAGLTKFDGFDPSLPDYELVRVFRSNSAS